MEAALGEARLTLSIPGWPEGSVEPKELTFVIAEESLPSWGLRNAWLPGLAGLLAIGWLVQRRWRCPNLKTREAG